MSNRFAPIGVFDSGLGGLTLVQALQRSLPKEDIIYYGDTLRVPYGDQDKNSLINYALQITDFLKKFRIKLLLIACNSISSVVYQHPAFKNRNWCLNVIDPLVEEVKKQTQKRSIRIGLLGTKITISSRIFEKLLSSDKLQLFSLATPRLAPLIEHFMDTRRTVHDYLRRLPKIDQLILGCTHYPWIKEQFEIFYQGKVLILDATELTVRQVKTTLQREDLLNDNPINGGVSLYWSKLTLEIKRFIRDSGINYIKIEEKLL